MSEMSKIKRNPSAAKIAQAILEEYEVISVRKRLLWERSRNSHNVL